MGGGEPNREGYSRQFSPTVGLGQHPTLNIERVIQYASWRRTRV